jgi:hypothetical protein
VGGGYGPAVIAAPTTTAATAGQSRDRCRATQIRGPYQGPGNWPAVQKEQCWIGDALCIDLNPLLDSANFYVHSATGQSVLAAVRFDTFFGDGWAKGGLAICH